jgi:hypothetical protein
MSDPERLVIVASALSLGRFLQTVKENRDLFSDTAFRKRLEENEHLETLVEDRTIDDAELAGELASVYDSDPLVSRLRVLRNETISHTAADRVMLIDQLFLIGWFPLPRQALGFGNLCGSHHSCHVISFLGNTILKFSVLF